jgi:hypothetical protein
VEISSTFLSLKATFNTPFLYLASMSESNYNKFRYFVDNSESEIKFTLFANFDVVLADFDGELEGTSSSLLNQVLEVLVFFFFPENGQISKLNPS